MRILVVSQYFWPESFRINDLVVELVARGHEVTVLTGQPNYPSGTLDAAFARQPEDFDRYGGADVVRVPHVLRGGRGVQLMLNYLTFALSASVIGAFKLRGRPFDAVFAFEPSPITIGIPAIVLKWIKRAPMALWVLDLWPQTLQAVGAVRSPLVLGSVDSLVRMIYRHCDAILAQSRSFIRTIQSQVRERDHAKIIYFPSWAEPAEQVDSVQPAAEIASRPDLFTVLFTGNVGEAQGFEAVLAAAVLLRDKPVRWVIIGDGRRSDWLRSEVIRLGLSAQVMMLGRFPLERMSSFMAHADALLVCLRDEPVFALTIPGKVQSYLMAGRPVLAMLNGEGANVVAESGAGIAVAAGDALGLSNAITQMLTATETERAVMGRAGLAYSEANFDRSTLISQLEHILSNLAYTAIAPANF
ncbi:glycosyltransferase family 4 protein [Devosia sp. MC521]|uniref:glycosyltransferase family 4 protein n=1 Tax=Devosia sp. MC521 TaxID=2759954 RepID=UPI0015FD3BBA|nr:glycosyltransferase family 4 protein [Devosia sp. MC521]MBJ6989012.1 glycosyltransferase family 4 protein [Devosia sp. MC521]QMW62970.1 glycosyltransferase family 4 protein [Devosia sp. MC521]